MRIVAALALGALLAACAQTQTVYNYNKPGFDQTTSRRNRRNGG